MSSTTGIQSTNGVWSWPGIIGFTMEDAMLIILRDKPDADIVFLPVGSPVTTSDFCPNRVRIFLDTIVYPPRVVSSNMDITGDQKKTCLFEETQKKTCWPEFVGLSIMQAVPSILKDMPHAQIEVLALNSPMTCDFCPNLVRIFVETVAQTPMVG